jgi:hypothetical protein
MLVFKELHPNAAVSKRAALVLEYKIPKGLK